MDEDYSHSTVVAKNGNRLFGSNGNGITYSNMTAIQRPWKMAKIEAPPLQPVQIEAIKWSFASQFIGQPPFKIKRE